MRSTFLVLHALALTCLASTGCGDDGSAEDSTVGMSATDSTTASSSTSATGSTGDSATSVASGTMGSTGPDTTATTAPTSMGDTTWATGVDTDALECFGLDEDACSSNPQCMAIVGTPILFPDGGACLGPSEFLDCRLATGCGDAITYACAGLDAPLYQFLDTCIPEGWSDCGAPPPVELLPC